MKNSLILGVAALILGLGLGWAVGTSSGRYGGTTGLDSLALKGNLSVDGTAQVYGALTVPSLSVTGTALLGTSGSSVGVGTSTNLGADVHVYSGTASVSSTLALGTSAHGASARGVLCFWNDTNYTLVRFIGNTTTPTYATSTSCP